MIKILVIGNGFDKAHGLKTGYGDFIEWAEVVYGTYEVKWDENLVPFTSDQINVCKLFRDNYLDEYQEVVGYCHNFWLHYFLKKYNELGEKWLDFESEIQRFTAQLYKQLEGEITVKAVPKRLQKACNIKSPIPDFSSKNAVFEWLNSQLKELSRFLEIYLCCYANGTLDKKARREPFTYIEPDYLLSFNYTSTYHDVYRLSIDTDYIHGEANLKNTFDKCNLVLGFDDHYVETADTISELIPFEKYYQRIVKRTSNDYFKWVETTDEDGNPEEKQVFFYGHSLSPADGDIIKLLIEGDNTTTKIYYRKDHEEERASMIKNLAQILTPDGLIKRVGGSNPTIEFLPI